ncbi:MAG: ornithine aminomutase [Clostridiales bacterium]|nr:ornithine aminomutase [Clostridiales bacterium]
MVKREDDYQKRRAHLASLSDEELRARFWALTGRLVDPMLALAKENTTPAIERSVLLRMGFSSLEAKALVDGCMERCLLGHGAGHVVYRYARHEGLPIREAGLALMSPEKMDEAARLFGGEA